MILRISNGKASCGILFKSRLATPWIERSSEASVLISLPPETIGKPPEYTDETLLAQDDKTYFTTITNTGDTGSMQMPIWFKQKTRSAWVMLRLAVKKFFLINGSQWAEAFSYNAFFSLFPLMILLVTIASTFTD